MCNDTDKKGCKSSYSITSESHEGVVRLISIGSYPQTKIATGVLSRSGCNNLGARIIIRTFIGC